LIIELRGALDHFHCALREADLQLLIASFPRDDGTFDFKAFASRLYPHQDKYDMHTSLHCIALMDGPRHLIHYSYHRSGFEVIRDGRHLHTLPATYAAAPPAAAAITSSSGTVTSRSLDGNVYPPPLGDTQYYESKEIVPIAECNTRYSHC
jgi:hypothetical protein